MLPTFPSTVSSKQRCFSHPLWISPRYVLTLYKPVWKTLALKDWNWNRDADNNACPDDICQWSSLAYFPHTWGIRGQLDIYSLRYLIWDRRREHMRTHTNIWMRNLMHARYIRNPSFTTSTTWMHVWVSDCNNERKLEKKGNTDREKQRPGHWAFMYAWPRKTRLRHRKLLCLPVLVTDLYCVRRLLLDRALICHC